MTDTTNELIASLNKLAAEHAEYYQLGQESRRDSALRVASWKSLLLASLPAYDNDRQKTDMMNALLEIALDWRVRSLPIWRYWSRRDTHKVVTGMVEEAFKRMQAEQISAKPLN